MQILINVIYTYYVSCGGFFLIYFKCNTWSSTLISLSFIFQKGKKFLTLQDKQITVNNIFFFDWTLEYYSVIHSSVLLCKKKKKNTNNENQHPSFLNLRQSVTCGGGESGALCWEKHPELVAFKISWKAKRKMHIRGTKNVFLA